VTDPREPFETDSPVEGASAATATDLDDAAFEQRGSVDLETGAGEIGAAEGSGDTADLAAGALLSDDEAADATPEVETGDPDSLATDPLAAPAADSDAPAAEVAAEDEDPAEAMKKALRIAPGDWYVVHSYAGYENKVKTNLEARIQSLDVEDYIYQIEVPTEEVTEIKNGKRAQVNRKVLPGYLLVRMELNDESWGAVRNTPGVTGFVGATSRPSPLTIDEVVKILVPAITPQAARASGGDGRGRGLRGRRVRHRHGRAVRDPARHDQRDQRRAAEAAGAGLDLRPRDSRRAVVQPGQQDIGPRRPHASHARHGPLRRGLPAKTNHHAHEEGMSCLPGSG
jgi:transcription antitermination factor NusG